MHGKISTSQCCSADMWCFGEFAENSLSHFVITACIVLLCDHLLYHRVGSDLHLKGCGVITPKVQTPFFFFWLQDIENSNMLSFLTEPNLKLLYNGVKERNENCHLEIVGHWVHLRIWSVRWFFTDTPAFNTKLTTWDGIINRLHYTLYLFSQFVLSSSRTERMLVLAMQLHFCWRFFDNSLNIICNYYQKITIHALSVTDLISHVALISQRCLFTAR